MLIVVAVDQVQNKLTSRGGNLKKKNLLPDRAQRRQILSSAADNAQISFLEGIALLYLFLD